MEKIKKCHYYRNEDYCVWCELGMNFMSNKDKSDCDNHSCKSRYEVEVLKFS